jgi:FtsH-binding integral membrane protein
MIWNKPKNIWQWLMLLSPGAASVFFTAFGKTLPKDQELIPSLLGLPVAFVLCVVIGYLLARKTGDFGKVFGLSLLFIFLLLVINFSIAIGGCAVMQPYFDVR